jgi:hypothetical protein
MTDTIIMPGQRVIVRAHPETHDFGERAGFVISELPKVPDREWVILDPVEPLEGRVSLLSIPRAVLIPAGGAGGSAPPPHEQLRRAAIGIATLLILFGALFWLTCRPAQAQEASALAFYVAPQETGVRVVETGRWVKIPLPQPPPYVRGRLTCAVNVNRYLARMGKPGTGSALAMSFLRWGRPSGPQPGAIQVERRRGGGHVKIVSHHDGARWMCVNPSASRQQWRLTPCGGRAVAWRAA